MIRRQLGGLPPDKLLSEIRNYYWQLRALRPGEVAKRRALYRRIAERKAALIAGGFDGELLRLYCRQLASLDPAAVARYEQYARSLQKSDGQMQKTMAA